MSISGKIPHMRIRYMEWQVLHKLNNLHRLYWKAKGAEILGKVLRRNCSRATLTRLMAKGELYFIANEEPLDK